MRGNLPQAERRLVTLDKACFLSSKYADLQKAVERYKSSGNQYVAAP